MHSNQLPSAIGLLSLIRLLGAYLLTVIKVCKFLMYSKEFFSGALCWSSVLISLFSIISNVYEFMLQLFIIYSMCNLHLVRAVNL